MPDINIQFHALPEEIGEWLREWIDREHFNMAALSFSPFVAKKVEPAQIQSVVADQSIRRLSLLLEPPDLTAKFQSDFADRHSDQLILDVGHITRDGLCQSWLACRTDNSEAIKVWRRIAADLKKRTKEGVTSINRQNGASGLEKQHRYSDGAKALESRGVEMLSIVGPGKGPRLQLGDTRGQQSDVVVQ